MNVISETLKRTGSLFRLFLLISVFIGISAQAQNPSNNSHKADVYHKGTKLNLKPGEVLLNRGHWTSQVVDGYTCIEFRGDGSESWNISKCVELGTFEMQAEGVAMLTREAGTLILNGEFRDGSGEGRYSYTPDRRFNRYLNRKFDSEEVEFTLPLFLGNMQTDFMDFLEDHYGEIDADDLTQLALYDVTQADFEQYLSLYREYDSKNPVLEDIVATKLNGIDREYVEALQNAGYDQLNLDQMKQAKTHGVSSEVIAGLQQAGFDNIPFDLLIRTRASGLSVETAQELQNIGQGDLSLEAMIVYQQRGVDATYIKQLQAVGFTPLSLEQIAKANAMDIQASFVTALDKAELETDFSSVLLAKAANLDIDYISAYADSGLDGISLTELVTAKQAGVSFEGIESWDELGSGDVSFQELLQAAMLGVDSTDLDAFRKEGVEVFSLAELISARLHEVDVGFVRQVKGVPVSQIADSVPSQEQLGDLSEVQTSEDSTDQAQADPNQDMRQAVAQAQRALFNTPSETQDNELAEIQGDFPTALHQYITLKLTQDALRAQETLELKTMSERAKQERAEQGQEGQESGLRHLGL